jgi:phage tail-like protein
MASNVDPYRSYNFKLDITGMTDAHFTQCGGFGVKVTPIQYREGGNNQVVRHIPGPVEYSAVTLRYGLTSSRELWDWMLTSIQGRAERKNVSIIMLDSEGANEVMRWNLVDAWPSEWYGAPLDALSKEIAIEGLTLVFDSMERV